MEQLLSAGPHLPVALTASLSSEAHPSGSSAQRERCWSPQAWLPSWLCLGPSRSLGQVLSPLWALVSVSVDWELGWQVEEVSEDSFQDPVEGENPNSADWEGARRRVTPRTPTLGQEGLKQRPSSPDQGGAAQREDQLQAGSGRSISIGHSHPPMKVLVWV